MTKKTISQIVGEDGKPAAQATSAPNCFIYDGKSPSYGGEIAWGETFADPRRGNNVKFFVTGEEYFQAVATAFKNAQSSIYITGWQVNFDVELAGGKTLFEYLEAAIDANKQLRIYVMPWLSPKVGVDTGDFETTLAIYQLNAGLGGPARAFALPAMEQSDMTSGMAIGFSHHQKLVVIDNRIAFVGGIDLAYGRRDDGEFSLAANGRTGNEIYNTCIPQIQDITNVEQTKYLTRLELLAACFDGVKGAAGTFATSAPMVSIAHAMDAANSAGQSIGDASKQVGDWWNNVNILPDLIRTWQAVPGELAEKGLRAAYHNLDQHLNGKLEFLRSSGSANVANASSALLGWLNNAGMEQLPYEVRNETAQLIQMFTIATLTHLQNSADRLPSRYLNLKKLRKIVPHSGRTFSAGQPRMPWHDVHSLIEGPSVCDLSRNFELRWNSIARKYEHSCKFVSANAIVRGLFKSLGQSPTSTLKIPRIPPSPLPKTQPNSGSAWIQVLRSAPLTLLRDEARASGGKVPKTPQNNCLKAMLTAISGAQKFLYIEGQFFQSEYGKNVSDIAPSGPLSALVDIEASKNYKQHVRTLGIEGLSPEEYAAKINWTRISEVRRDQEFMNDLYEVLKNVASIKASKQLGKSQEGLLNPIGDAIAQRIEKAINDGLPFHVYMVLPVHPEGTLNTLNIMTQVHLTMQSLVFGEDSLVNRVRRAIIVNSLAKSSRISLAEARDVVASYDQRRFIRESAGWIKYLTLLNLRNWQVLNGRPVTEQIYVHSKLLIADDRVAVLGSANINDRSQLGNRDSELAVIIRDDAKVRVKLDGENLETVSSAIHDLRCRLWKKLFGMMGGKNPATSLGSVIDIPASPKTWQAIQQVARANSIAYQNAFNHVPTVDGDRTSIWPTWEGSSKKLQTYMPFNERFWRGAGVREHSFSWDGKVVAPEHVPVGVQGYIVQLPLMWTERENNLSGMNLSLLAHSNTYLGDGRRLTELEGRVSEIQSRV
jgi:phospholipase D1/2